MSIIGTVALILVLFVWDDVEKLKQEITQLRKDLKNEK